MKVIPLEAALPLFAGKIEVNPSNPADWNFDSKHLMGTVFRVKENIYMTAAHVVKDAVEKGELATAYLNDQDQVKVARVLKMEALYEYDIAFLEINVPRATQFPWSFDDAPSLSDVKAIGYPHALDIQKRRFTTRGQKGHIVSDCLSEITGGFEQRVYELSFPVFEGMSGAALLLPDSTQAKIIGVCLGNRVTEMNVFNSREVIEENGKKEVFEKYYAHTLGIAIKTSSFEHVKSRLFAGTFREFVTSKPSGGAG